MKRSRTKCEPLVGINNNDQLAMSSSVKSQKTTASDQQLMVNIQGVDSAGGGAKSRRLGLGNNKRQRRSAAAVSATSLVSSGSTGSAGGSASVAGSDLSTSGSSANNSGGPAEKPVQQRNAANARERQRMRVLSKAFCRLKTSLPWVPPDTKLSKLDTLRLASCYIAHLKQILDDDQPPSGNGGSNVVPSSGNSGTGKSSSGRPGKQNSAVLSAVSASTSKLLSMALPIAANQSAANRLNQFPPSLPLMSWPFASRTIGPNSGSSSTGPSNNNNGRCQSSNSGGNVANNSNGKTSTSPRQVGGQLGQLYAQFKDRLLVLPNNNCNNNNNNQSVAMATHQNNQNSLQNNSQKSSIYPSPPNIGNNGHQIFATPPSSSPSWSSNQGGLFASPVPSNGSHFGTVISNGNQFCTQSPYQTNNSSMLYSNNPQNNNGQYNNNNNRNQQSSSNMMTVIAHQQPSSCYFANQPQLFDTNFNFHQNQTLRNAHTGAKSGQQLNNSNNSLVRNNNIKASAQPATALIN